MVGFPNNHDHFLLKMIILGWRLGVPPFKETPISHHLNIRWGHWRSMELCPQPFGLLGVESGSAAGMENLLVANCKDTLGTQSGNYSFSHYLWFSGKWPYLKGNYWEGPIFDFHDYGRKYKAPYLIVFAIFRRFGLSNHGNLNSHGSFTLWSWGWQVRMLVLILLMV